MPFEINITSNGRRVRSIAGFLSKVDSVEHNVVWFAIFAYRPFEGSIYRLCAWHRTGPDSENARSIYGVVNFQRSYQISYNFVVVHTKLFINTSQNPSKHVRSAGAMVMGTDILSLEITDTAALAPGRPLGRGKHSRHLHAWMARPPH